MVIIVPCVLSMIKAAIFDLDNCLAPSREIGEELFAPAFTAMREANDGRVPPELLDKAFDDLWRQALDKVAAKYGFSEAMREAGWRVFTTLEVRHRMSGYGDLAALAELPILRFLVTSGFRRLQQSKVRMLDLEPLFAAIHVDAIDEPGRIGKEGWFRRILAERQLRPAEILVVGDDPESEIALGNRLGMRTVQTLRPGVTKTGLATGHVDSLEQLKALLGGGG